MKVPFSLIPILLLSLSLKAQIDFDMPEYYTLNEDVVSCEIVDINDDGRNDALIATKYEFDEENRFHVYIFFQNTFGSFDSPESLSFESIGVFGATPVMKVADLNNDNLLDIAIGSGSHLGVFFQNYSHTFEPLETWYSGEEIDAIDIGDLNNDGLEDVAISHCCNEEFISVFYQDAIETFSVEQYYIEPGGWLCEINIADVNNDGLNDLVYMPGFGSVGTLVIYYQDEIIGLNPDYIVLDYQAGGNDTKFNGFAIGDLNNDGRNDIVGSIGGNTAWLAIIYQNDTGGLNDAIYISAHDIPTPVQIADIDCNGTNEIIVGHHAWGRFSVFEQDIYGNYNDYDLFHYLYYITPYALAVGDMNNDGRADVLTTDGQDDVVFVYNTSVPDTFLSLDTIVEYQLNLIDTVNTHWPYISNIVTIDTIDNCITRTSQDCEIIEHDMNYHAIGDTIVYRRYNICGSLINDSIISAFEIDYDYTLYDSACTILSIDTLFNYYYPIDSIYVYDTLETHIEYFVDTTTIEETYVSNDTLYVITDIVLIQGQQFVSIIMVDFYEVYEGLKCGDIIFDTIQNEPFLLVGYDVISADTLILEHSEEAFYINIETYSNKPDVKLYPNPTNGNLHIEAEQISKIDILSISGETIRSYICDKNLKENIIDISNLSDGSYIIRIFIGNEFILKKIIKHS